MKENGFFDRHPKLKTSAEIAGASALPVLACWAMGPGLQIIHDLFTVNPPTKTEPDTRSTGSFCRTAIGVSIQQCIKEAEKKVEHKNLSFTDPNNTAKK